MRDLTRKRLGLSFIILCALIFGGFSWADSAKIGIVDTQKILQESKGAKAARERLMAEVKEKRAQFQRSQEEAMRLQKELNSRSRDASPEDLRAKRDKLAREMKTLKRLKIDMEDELRKKNMGIAKKILEEIKEVIEGYRKKHKLAVILEKKTVITADESIDITDEIIKIYDAKK
jgi:outer membrane protein